MYLSYQTLLHLSFIPRKNRTYWKCLNIASFRPAIDIFSILEYNLKLVSKIKNSQKGEHSMPKHVFFLSIASAAMIFLFVGAISFSIEKIIALGGISITSAILAVATKK